MWTFLMSLNVTLLKENPEILILSVLFPPIFKTMNAAFQILKNVE